MDEEPKKWITTKNDVHVPIEEGETKKEACKEFFKEKQKEQANKPSKTIAGVKKGKPMSFKEANEGRVNPNYDKDDRYKTNCQSCIAVFEARLRGYNVETNVSDNTIAKELSYKPNLAYKDPQTGENPPIIKSHVRDAQSCKKWLNEHIKSGERYAFGYSPELTIGERGHIIVVYKTDNDHLNFYDPQDGKNFDEKFLDDIGYETPFGDIIICFSPMIFRIDDKELNYEILNKIAQPVD